MNTNASIAEPVYLTAAELKGRGWTDALIARFLGEPDERRANPHYRRAAPMKLFRAERVLSAEGSAEFLACQQARVKRRAVASKAVETKRRRTAEYVAAVEIAVPDIDRDRLIQLASAHYNHRQEDRIGDNFASPDSDPAFLERITVNYLRHRITDYETHLSRVEGKVGTAEAYLHIKAKVLEAVAGPYEWLAAECDRQNLEAATTVGGSSGSA